MTTSNLHLMRGGELRHIRAIRRKVKFLAPCANIFSTTYGGGSTTHRSYAPAISNKKGSNQSG